jgi:hypothetical protein
MEPSRPMIKPGLRQVWRGPDTLQLGVDVPFPLVLHPVDAAVQSLLAALDGRSTWAQVMAVAGQVGLGETQTRTLLGRLTDSGLLTDAATPDPDWAELPVEVRDRLAPDRTAWSLADPRPDAAARHTTGRRRLAVVLVSADPLSVPLAEGLAAADVGSVETVAHPDLASGAGGRGHLVVIPSALARVHRRQLLETSTPHLVTEVGETVVRLGPLVTPGRSACFGCLEHGRIDRDDGWGPISAQLAGGQNPSQPTTLLRAAAGFAVLHLLDWATGGTPPEVDGLLELRLPHGRAVRRSCPPHPACGCTWPTTPGHVTMSA